VAVVGETMARRIWGGEDPIGRCIHVGGPTLPCSTVVGIAADPRRASIAQEEETFQYWIPAEPLQSDVLRPTNLVVRVSDPGAVDAVHRELLAMDPRIRFVRITSFREVIAPQMRSWIASATLFSAFGLLALIVAALGLYSLIAFDVAQRTREIGIRTALGALRRSVVRLVVIRALWLTGLGVAIGLTAAALLSPRIDDLLFGVSAHDPATFAAVGAVLMLVAVLAAGFPAHRASRVDPIVALRNE
jgi:ABC-type antimicrobial peptide transport system permease subunit